MTDKISLFEEGLQENIDIVAFAHEFDFSDSELLRVSGIEKCPKCNGVIECVDGHIHCIECDWVME